MVTLANQICNMALDLLKEAPMNDYTTETTSEALWFQRNYETCRDAELEKHPWRFAMKRDTLTADATAPEFGWDYRYSKPTDFMRIGYLNYTGDFEGTPLPHEIEGDWILCDQSSSIYLVYVYRVTDPSKHLALFNKALAAQMAVDLAHWLTGKTSMVQVAAAKYDQALRDARRANALLSTPERAYDSDVIAARYSSGFVG